MSDEESNNDEHKHDDNVSPNWDNVNTLFDKLDEVFTEFGTEKEMTYIEMDTVLYMLNEKIFQQKIISIAHMLSEGSPNVQIDSNSGMYK